MYNTVKMIYQYFKIWLIVYQIFTILFFIEKIKVNESLKSSIHVICSYLYVCSLKQNYLQYLVVHSKETLISKSLIAFLYNVLELPVQMSWDNNEEINKEGLYQQALGFDIQHSQTHRPS